MGPVLCITKHMRRNGTDAADRVGNVVDSLCFMAISVYIGGHATYTRSATFAEIDTKRSSEKTNSTHNKKTSIQERDAPFTSCAPAAEASAARRPERATRLNYLYCT